MRRSATAAGRGFTLVELLVVLSILAILAGLLFPAFASAKRAALKAACLVNFRSATQSAMLYAADYEDRLMPTNHRPGMPPDPVLDRVWPQILSPYAGRGFAIFDCPAEPNPASFGGSFDPDLVPGDYAARYYQAALHSDLGYNAYYLAPVIRQGDGWVAVPKGFSEVGEPSRTLLFVESRAEGGGSYIVAPPCRYIADHNVLIDTFLSGSVRPVASADPLYKAIDGWEIADHQTEFPIGGVGVRHGDRLNVSRLDGSASSVTLNALEQGCQVRAGWQGSITDPARYVWFAAR